MGLRLLTRRVAHKMLSGLQLTCRHRQTRPVGFDKKSAAAACSSCSISSRHKGGSRPKGGCSATANGYPLATDGAPWRAIALISGAFCSVIHHQGPPNGSAADQRWFVTEKVGGLDLSQVTGPKKTSKWESFNSRFQTVNRWGLVWLLGCTWYLANGL